MGFTLFRRSRFFWRLMHELTRQYTKALVIGLFFGIIGTISVWKFFPWIRQTFFVPTTRIGVIGEFTPTTLPLSIQQKMSYGLATVAPDGSPQPGLATSWVVSDEGKTYTFTLQEHLFWHNGTPVLAKDVNYNIKNVTFTPLSAHTLKATLKESFSPFPTLVAKPVIQTGLRGFGPYKVVSIRLKGDTVNYLKLVSTSPQKPQAIEYRFYQTEMLALVGYQLGDVDQVEEIASREPLTHLSKTRITERTRNDRIVTIFFNLKDQRLGERSFRQALGYSLPAFDEERAFSPLSSTSWAYTDKVRHFVPANVSQAKKLLANTQEATQSAELTITTFAGFVDTVQAISDSWKKYIGIATSIKVENALPSTYQILVTSQSIPPDPDQYPFWHSTQTNITGYLNVKIDKLLEDGRREMDQTKRKAIYADFQRRLVEDAPAIFLFYPKTYTITREGR